MNDSVELNRPERMTWQTWCLHPTCRVLTYAWSKPGDSCPGCGWGSTPGSAVTLPDHKEFVS